MGNQEDRGASPDGDRAATASQPSPAVSGIAGIPSAWPQTLTPELADILGRQCFTFIRLSQMFRMAGHEIPTSAEAEQAFFLYRFLTLWFEHGDGWRDAFNAEAREAARIANAVIAARDSDEHRNGEDPKGLSGEAMPARAEGIAHNPDAPQSPTPNSSGGQS